MKNKRQKWSENIIIPGEISGSKRADVSGKSRALPTEYSRDSV
jgi:hypothetical protein